MIDANGFIQSLLVRNGLLGLGKINVAPDDFFELPPDPPDGAFGARFKTGNYLQTVSSSNEFTQIPIVAKGAVFPITLIWDLQRENGLIYRLVLPGSARNDNREVKGKGSIVLLPLMGSNIPLEARADIARSIPTEYSLRQNYPNPFNPTTKIPYALPISSRVRLKIFNMLGQQVKTLVDEIQEAGFKTVEFDATTLPSGVYAYRLEARSVLDQTNSFSEGRKAVFLK